MAELGDIEDAISRLKLEGNDCLTSGNYPIATKHYTQALEHSIFKSDEYQESDKLIDLRQSLYLNRARSHFHQKNTIEAMVDTNKCIETNTDSKLAYKAHLVRAQIYLDGINDFKNALRHCDIILNVCASFN